LVTEALNIGDFQPPYTPDEAPAMGHRVSQAWKEYCRRLISAAP
jgi:hypothetical protein